jgi:hypothetical protein
MSKPEHIQYLREKYIQLNEQYQQELMQGKSIMLLKELSIVITTLAKEISELEEKLHQDKK